MPNINETYAYLAGFVDADGSISLVRDKYFDKKLNRDRYKYRIKLSVHNCKIEPIEVFKKCFGGGKLRNTRRGKAMAEHPNWRECYEWTLWSKQAEDAIRLLLPFLLIKKQQALLALEMQDLKHSIKTNDYKKEELRVLYEGKFSELKEACKLLNKRGK